MTTDTTTARAHQHDDEDRCYWCASDEDLARAMNGEFDRLVLFDVPESYCPMMGDVS